MSDILQNIPDENPYRSEKVLRELYLEEEHSTHEIADLLDCAQSTVRNWMDKYGIERRSKSEAKWVKGPHHRHWIRMEVQSSGHIKWKISVNNVDRSIAVHRLIAVAEYGFDAVRDNVVHHKNEIPWDNRPSNLELMDKGEHTSHHSQKVEEFDRLRIAEIYENGSISSRDLGEMFGIGNPTVLNIHQEFYGERSE